MKRRGERADSRREGEEAREELLLARPAPVSRPIRHSCATARSPALTPDSANIAFVWWKVCEKDKDFAVLPPPDLSAIVGF